MAHARCLPFSGLDCLRRAVVASSDSFARVGGPESSRTAGESRLCNRFSGSFCRTTKHHGFIDGGHSRARRCHGRRVCIVRATLVLVFSVTSVILNRGGVCFVRFIRCADACDAASQLVALDLAAADGVGRNVFRRRDDRRRAAAGMPAASARGLLSKLAARRLCVEVGSLRESRCQSSDCAERAYAADRMPMGPFVYRLAFAYEIDEATMLLLIVAVKSKRLRVIASPLFLFHVAARGIARETVLPPCRHLRAARIAANTSSARVLSYVAQLHGGLLDRRHRSRAADGIGGITLWLAAFVGAVPMGRPT
jgi:hypothetical protein